MGGTRTQRVWRKQRRWLAVAGPIAAGNAVVWNAGHLPTGSIVVGGALIVAGGAAWDVMIRDAFRAGYHAGVHDAQSGKRRALATAIPGLGDDAVVYHHAADGRVRGRVGHIDGEFVEPVVLSSGESLSVEIPNPAHSMPLDVRIEIMPPELPAPEDGGDEGALA